MAQRAARRTSPKNVSLREHTSATTSISYVTGPNCGHPGLLVAPPRVVGQPPEVVPWGVDVLAHVMIALNVRLRAETQNGLIR
jgi:hypothetical protein